LLFTESTPVRKKILTDVSFGGGTINDVPMYFSNVSLPLGGVGNS